MNPAAALFVSFEGIDGSGTTTQCERLCARLTAAGLAFTRTREPGGTALGERLRSVVLDPQIGAVDDTAELLLYAAARRQLVAEVLEPSLQRGEPVISDRYADSTRAYQGGGRGLPADTVETLIAVATGGLEPDVTILLDLDVVTATRRTRNRNSGADRLEGEGSALQEAVCQAYRSLARRSPQRLLVIDASPPADAVAEAVHAALLARFPRFPMK